MADPEKQHWIVGGLGGINLMSLGTIVVVVVWSVAQGHFGQNRSQEKIKSFENSLKEVSKTFDDIENQIDALRQTNTAIAIMEITSENTAGGVNRLNGKVDALQEGQRDLQSQVRELQRDMSRLRGEK